MEQWLKLGGPRGIFAVLDSKLQQFILKYTLNYCDVYYERIEKLTQEGKTNQQEIGTLELT